MKILERYYVGNIAKAIEYYRKLYGTQEIPVRLQNGMTGATVEYRSYKRVKPHATRKNIAFAGSYQIHAFFTSPRDTSWFGQAHRHTSDIRFESTY